MIDRAAASKIAWALVEAQREKREPRDGVPVTFGPGPRPGALERRIFDPSMKHYWAAFRKGEPELDSEDDRVAWRRCNRHALQHALRLVATHPLLREQLVLRGSATLSSWYGERSREPHDLDWVVRDPSLRMDSAEGKAIISALEHVLRAANETGELSLWPERIETDVIWTYDRIPGRRVSIPWKRDGLPAGVVQIDVVFNERLHDETQLENVCVEDGSRPARLRVASRAESLAWKILWLVSDAFPQGKDLFDAALLATDTRLSSALLQRVLAAGEFANNDAAMMGEGWRAALVANRYLDWDNFLREYPELDRDREAMVVEVLASVEPG